MILNVLISTIDNRILGIKNIYRSDSNVVFTISHQIVGDLNTETKEYIYFLKKQKNVIYSPLFSKGVAKNRNNALKHRVKNSICLLCDDDVVYFPDAFEKIIEIFEQDNNIDFLTFKIKTFSGNDYKKYRNYSYKHNIKTLSNIGIIDVAFREEIIDELGLNFDERFGPGGLYPIGEDFIFMTDAYKKGAKIIFKPIDIVMHEEIGTGRRLNDNIVWGRGAMFARVFHKIAYIIDIYFTFKHFKSYKKKYSLIKYLKLMFGGSKHFCKEFNCE